MKKISYGSRYVGLVRTIRRAIVGRSWLERLWWRYWPGVKVKLKWPKGTIVVGYDDPRWYDCGATWVEVESADPNDFYRPWLEKYVGYQGWHWNWVMEDNDAAENKLTLKVCKSKSKYATIAGIQWS